MGESASWESHPRENQILAYLRQGIACAVYPDPRMSRDVFDPSVRIETPPDEPGAGVLYTDGEWIWAGVTGYYVGRYHVRLPEEFVAHAEASGWRIDPSGVDPMELDCDAFAAPAPVVPAG